MFSFLFILICVVFVAIYTYNFIVDYVEIFNELSDDGKLDGAYIYAAEIKQKYTKEYIMSHFKGMKEIFPDIIKYIKKWAEKETY